MTGVQTCALPISLADLNETPHVLGVRLDQLIPEAENIHDLTGREPTGSRGASQGRTQGSWDLNGLSPCRIENAAAEMDSVRNHSAPNRAYPQNRSRITHIMDLRHRSVPHQEEDPP